MKTISIIVILLAVNRVGFCGYSVNTVHAGGGGMYIPPPTYNQAPLTPYQQQQIDQANYLAQQRQAAFEAQLAAQAAAVKEAAWEKFRDAKTSELATERDNEISNLVAGLSPHILELQAQAAPLEKRSQELERLKIQSEKENASVRSSQLKQQAKQLFQPKDPWRMMDGKIDYAKNPNWFQFTGTILQVMKNGILIHGNFGAPTEPGFAERSYFVENFPIDKYSLADNEKITKNMNFVAHVGGKTTYQFVSTTIEAGVQTVRRLDYGTVVDSPPADLIAKYENEIPTSVNAPGADPEIISEITENQAQLSAIQLKLSQAQIEFDGGKDKFNSDYEAKVNDLQNVYAKYLKDQDAQKKKVVQDKVLRWNLESAKKGDSYGLLRMAERYRDSEGVEKDLVKAKFYFQKAVDAGSSTASDELSKLNSASTNTVAGP